MLVAPAGNRPSHPLPNLRLVMHAALWGPGGELNHASDEAKLID
jgi:hypothetical protein